MDKGMKTGFGTIVLSVCLIGGLSQTARADSRCEYRCYQKEQECVELCDSYRYCIDNCHKKWEACINACYNPDKVSAVGPQSLISPQRPEEAAIQSSRDFEGIVGRAVKTMGSKPVMKAPMAMTDGAPKDHAAADVLSASDSARRIYESLKVAETPLFAPRTTYKYKKEVGGLACLKVSVIREETRYSCELAQGVIDSKVIYEAMDAAAIPLPANRMELKYKKQVANLACIQTDNILDGMSYSCSLD